MHLQHWTSLLATATIPGLLAVGVAPAIAQARMASSDLCS